MVYKQSIFNIYFNNNHKTYIYNSISGALISIDDNLLDYLNNISKNINPEKNDNFDLLSKKAFIVKANFDEFGYIFQKTQHYIYNQYPQNVSYTIATTRKCNFRCKYCFEGTTNIPEVDIDSNGVSDFIIGQIKMNPNLKHLRITWFGGEPLLNKAAIENITNKILPLIEAKKINYKASMVTNGFFLNEDLIKTAKIGSAQITLDGTNEIYADYKGTSISSFKKIYENIKQLSEINDFTLGIRINCDKNNTSSVFELMSMFNNDGLLHKFYVYLAPIYTGTDSDLSDEEFNNLQKKYYQYLKNNGYKDALAKQLHKSRIMSCGFMGYGSYVIDADGTLKKCERDIGDENKIIGNIYEGKFFNNVEIGYQLNDILDYCNNCKIYPICRGGCRKMRELEKSIKCEQEKEHLLYLLKMLV